MQLEGIFNIQYKLTQLQQLKKMYNINHLAQIRKTGETTS